MLLHEILCGHLNFQNSCRHRIVEKQRLFNTRGNQIKTGYDQNDFLMPKLGVSISIEIKSSHNTLKIDNKFINQFRPSLLVQHCCSGMTTKEAMICCANDFYCPIVMLMMRSSRILRSGVNESGATVESLPPTSFV